MTIVASTSNLQPIVANEAVYSRELRLNIVLQTRGYGANLPQGGFRVFADCSPPDYTEQGDSLIITSRFNYDVQHPAGTPLNDLLSVKASWASGEPFQPYELAQGLMFLQQPAASGPQQFRVRYHQTNGEVYTAETVVMNLLR